VKKVSIVCEKFLIGQESTHLDLLKIRLHIIGLFLLTLPLSLLAQQTPIGYESQVVIPDGVTGFNLPSTVYFEKRHGEIYVVDTGNGRIVIFDTNGTYLFEFSDRKHIPAPVGIAVDSLGHLIVLADRNTSQLPVFDYNGTYLHDITLNDSLGHPVAASSITIDDNDRLYALSTAAARVYIFSVDGAPLGGFNLPNDTTQTQEAFPIVGEIAYFQGKIAVPMPSLPEVDIFSTDGKLIRPLGIAGGDVGSIAFPVAAASDGKDGYVVLDKHRHVILHYNAKGEFLKEFGGMGVSKGWFYHPSSLASDGKGRCFILQSFQDRVQIYRIPEEKPADTTEVSVVAPAGATVPAVTSNKKN
jgi:hypothetical protein